MSVLLVSGLVAWALGLALVRLLWPAAVPFGPARVAAASLGLGVWMALTGVARFFWLVLVGPGRAGYLAAELVALIVLGGLGWRRHRLDRLGSAGPSEGPAVVPAITRILTAAFVATAVSAAAGFAGLSFAEPHGGWDAWMDWNLRARFLFRAGAAWRDSFSGLIPWSHPDYPLVVQGAVLRQWTYAGRELLAGSAMVAFSFAAATAGLLGAALALFRTRGQAALGAIVLLATPFFVAHAASQFADVPVGFAFLATVVLLGLHERHAARTVRFAALAGLTSGLAMWTKNEGLLFLAALVAAHVLVGIVMRADRPTRRAREYLAFGAGVMVPALLLGYFKFRFAPPNDLMSTVGAGQTLAWLTDPRRYAIALIAFGRHILGFGHNGLVSAVWLLATYAFCVGLRAPREERRWSATMGLTVVLMLAGHFIVFIGTTPGVARLINSSLDRLLLQLWPSAVFLYFMTVPPPEAVVESPVGAPSVNEPSVPADPSETDSGTAPTPPADHRLPAPPTVSAAPG